MPCSKSALIRLVSSILSVKLLPSTDIPYTNAFSIMPLVLISDAKVRKKNKVHKFVDHKLVNFNIILEIKRL